MEFHVSRAARNRYEFDLSLFSYSGNVVFANFHAARLFAQKMNAKRDLIEFPDQAIKAGQINAMGLIDEILHLVIAQYLQEVGPDIFSLAMERLSQQLGAPAVEHAIDQFTTEFPPLLVYRGEISQQDYLSASDDGVENRLVSLEEMLLLWLANINPAYSPFQELFDDAYLEKSTAYQEIMAGLYDFFDTLPPLGGMKENLIDLLRSPALASPNSLAGQLEFIRARWGDLIGQQLQHLLTSLDLIAEEEKATFFGPGPSLVYDFSSLDSEPEQFTPDQDWMPNLVLIAKNAYVWLDQLSKSHQRHIARLDEIPEEELKTLAQSGITGLWLIGLWERSPASQRIKQLRGNPEAVASAYSLFSYDIAADLGGESAYQVLRQRAWKYGIRLASDMVPNHMGIDSRWVIEHPDWFIALNHSPFPAYTFNGPDLSWDDRVGLFIEDHYFNNSDAAVVFKRLDRWTGQEKYIYHGNDGTSTPWNDTAQLNYLLPEVREAVIQTILHVARKSPIIRFDAAMTLAKRHFSRLWYPEPGSGGDIPSRAEYGLTKDQLNAAMPNEFWREVVERVAAEAPDTLLLAEAFWLMEGYFVRTLGMHRVYNSAFMHMLRDERNAEYRQVIKNTIGFDPEILKRYVNFMNNPDERTAVDQFGKGDKYFGACTLLATLPGLPMLGHGQIEGFAEKYGMEYRRAYWDELPDEELVSRHQREIFPLLRQRSLFSQAENFVLYDFETTDGNINEDVFAYTNQSGNRRALIVYHNRYASTQGWIRHSSLLPDDANENGRPYGQRRLAEGLNITADPEGFIVFRDLRSNLEYIRSSAEIWQQGMYFELWAYQCHVFIDMRDVKNNQREPYSKLAATLNGRGVADIEEALREIIHEPIYSPFRELVNEQMVVRMVESQQVGVLEDHDRNSLLEDVEHRANNLLTFLSDYVHNSQDISQLSQQIRREVQQLLELSDLAVLSHNKDLKTVQEYILAGPSSASPLVVKNQGLWGSLYAWCCVHRLGELSRDANPPAISHTWMDEWLLTRRIAESLRALGLEETRANKFVDLIRLATKHQRWSYLENIPDNKVARILDHWLEDVEVQRFLQINQHQGVVWFNKEAYRELVWWMFISELIIRCADQQGSSDLDNLIPGLFQIIQSLREAEERSEYRVDKLRLAVNSLTLSH